jgi:hypothetical protein
MSDPPLRLGELIATITLAQDDAFGQPLESPLRSCLLPTIPNVAIAGIVVP